MASDALLDRSKLSIEAALVLSCATTAATPARTELASETAARVIGWDRVIDIAKHHAILPLVHRYLKAECPSAVPEPAIAKIRTEWQLIILYNRHLTAELVRLMGLLETAGIPAVTFKGPVLAAMAYGSIELRQFSDLDILVRQTDLPQIAKILTGQGYVSPHTRREGLATGYFQESEDAFFAAYYGRFTQDSAKYLSASGDERRNVFDVHFAATRGGFDLDFEAMAQTGNIGDKGIWAWAVGAIVGYTFEEAAWSPRVGLQFDIASGNNDPQGSTLGTFNPLFPNGYYFALAGYTGYPNLIHLKPSLTLQPMKSMRVMLAVAPQWRQTTADAIYTQPNIPVPGTAGQPGSYTGAYGQLRLDWTLTPNLNFAVEAVHFAVSDVIRRAGGRDADWLGVQLTLAW